MRTTARTAAFIPANNHTIITRPVSVCVCVNYQHLTQHKNFYFFLLLHNQFSQFYGVRMDNNYTVSKKRANFGKLSIFII